MGYNVYISYSMSNSGKAYDLSGQLSKRHISYHLDCIESGFTLNDYTKNIIEKCQVYVVLVGTQHLDTNYANATLHHAIAHGKEILICPIDNAQLSEELILHTIVTEQELSNEIESLLKVGAFAHGEKKNIKGEALGALVLQLREHAIEVETASETKTVKISTPNIETVHPKHRSKWKERQLRNRQLHEEQAERLRKQYPILSKIALGLYFLMHLSILIFAGVIAYRQFAPTTQKTLAEQNHEDVPIADKKEGARLNKLATNYYNGKNGIKRDRKTAMKLYEEAAELGNVDAMYNLAVAYKTKSKSNNASEGNKRVYLRFATNWAYDATKAGHRQSLELLRSIADMDVPEAQNCMGICYSNGYGISKEKKQACYWFEKAANNGNPHAKYNLAYYYNNGIIKKQDKQKAYDLYMEAAAKGVIGARDIAEEILNELQ